jgi:hypothetical protein
MKPRTPTERQMATVLRHMSFLMVAVGKLRKMLRTKRKTRAAMKGRE